MNPTDFKANMSGRKVLLATFIMLAFISSTMLYYAHQFPIEEESVSTLYEYYQRGTFNYSATLKPNVIYNKTTLEPGEGPMFTRIIDDINVNCIYTFEGTKPANLTVHYNVKEYLLAPNWQRQIAETQQETLSSEGPSTNLLINNIPPVDISSLKILVNNITQETGINMYEYNVTIVVQMSIEAETTEGLISESFTPQLMVGFKSSYTEGDVISIEGLQHSKNGKITNTNTIHNSWVVTQRYTSYILSGISFPGLLIVTWYYLRNRPTKPKKPEALIEEIIEPFKEIITETAEEPQFKDHFTKISLNTLQDLAKVADTLAKPIVHTFRPPETHIFYVIDETTRYEFTMTESMIEKAEKEEE